MKLGERMEVFMKEKQISTDPLTQAVILGHNACQLFGRLSVVAAVWTGLKIAEKKNQLGHGNGFTAWRDQLPFGKTTAAKYVGLAREFGERHPELSGRISELKLLSGGGDALQPATALTHTSGLAEVAAQVERATGGAALTDLYEELGIIRRKRVFGGNPVLAMWIRDRHPELDGQVMDVDEIPAELVEDYEAFRQAYLDRQRVPKVLPTEYYAQRWTERVGALRQFVLDKEEFKKLPETELRMGYQALMDCAHYIKTQCRF